MSRIAAIQVCGYRGFPHPVTIWLAPHGADGKPSGPGKNFVLYGENGEDAIFAVDELEQTIRKAIAMRQAGPVLLRQMLLSLLHNRPLALPQTAIP